MSEEILHYLVSRLLKNAEELANESHECIGDAFYDGKKLAYYEMLSILQSELAAQGENLVDFGLDIDLLQDLSL